MQTTIDAAQLKVLMKEAVVEVLEERRDLLQSALEDAMEDAALGRAIEEGRTGEMATREEVFQVLNSE